VSTPDRLDHQTRTAIADAGNDILLSTATVWEIAIKHVAGRLVFPLERLDELIQAMDLTVLPILPSHALRAATLPRIHADPFDRVLIAQALVESLALVSSDATVRRYRVPVLGQEAHP
jgi:PIN domain nuclease of toxin-antitoxin system